MDTKIIWKIIDSHFKDNPQCLVRHHTESYNDFFKNGIYKIFKEKNPITIQSRFDQSIGDYRSQCRLYMGGKDGTKIYFGKPIIYDAGNVHYMFPNEARLRNMTYGMTIHYDIDIEFLDILEPGETPSIIGSGIGQGIGQGIGPGIATKKTGGGVKEVDGNLVHFDDLSDDVYLSDAEYDGGEEYNKDNYKVEAEMIDGLFDLAKVSGFLGGAKNPAKPVPKRNTRNKKADLQMTPAIAAMIREATEKSMVGQNTQRREITIEKVFLGKFPIMLQSDFCVLSGMPREMRYNVGECKNDLGGYFIIDGKEKTVIPQEKFADNMLYIRKGKDDDVKLYSAEIHSVSENVSKPVRTFSVSIVAPSAKYTNENIVVNIPNVRKPVPLFIVFRALGFLSDKEIIQMCLLDLEKYDSMVDLFIPSVHDAGGILTQHTALKYIATLTKGKTIPHVHEILSDYFLPHIGEINYIQKGYFLGYMVFRLLSVRTGLENPTDRDNFKYKRMELVGSLLNDLFREYYSIQQKEIHLDFEKALYYNQDLYEANLFGLIQQNYKEVFKNRSLETGFKKAFKGNWGAYAHTKRIGIIQDLNRLSFNSALSHLRKTNLPLDATAKIVGPRLLHSSQWGIIDPIDTPDGGNIGLHKSLSICTYVSQGASREPMTAWLREKVKMKLVEECDTRTLAKMTKVMVNGAWVGSLQDPIESVSKMRLFRRNGLIPIYTSITFEIKLNTIFIYTDKGRLCRPVFYRDDITGKISYDKKDIWKHLKEDKHYSWDHLITGFNKKRPVDYSPSNGHIYELHELYEGVESETNPAKLDRFLAKKAIVDYLDVGESENALIAMNPEEFEKGSETTMKYHTHCEIHESLTYGMMCNLIIFPENNPPTRNSFSCGQSKQAVSLYHTNFQVRMDKTAVVLNSGQIPLVKSRFMEYINHEENPYGENAIVAIMCYTGYNVEDAMLVNEGALKRGLFRTTYYSTYETHEENSMQVDVAVDKKFSNIESLNGVIGTKIGYDYSHLDKYGLILENTPVDEKTVLIGITSSNTVNPECRIDQSKVPKKGQLGMVDKTFMTEGEEGERIAKVRVREERTPNIGDKMASRAGQKGTIGLVVPECDMPFTKDGLRPDIIINPHALPSRMTIGQLVECITGKACAMYGAFGECTAFQNKGSKIGVYGELLPKVGFHSSGNEILYNGMTGEQLESEIFIGPTYYMRLKHMVKDKINVRARGPRTALTRQPVSGRANDGGLRIGEMERDTVISHGASNFLQESMMERGDQYYIAVCNQTGMLAIYQPSKNLFLSPMADGPIQFTSNINDSDLKLEHITRFGRDFSIVSIPYTLKLLIQELQTINVQMRIITEDNIQQIEHMSFSKNIQKLLLQDNAYPSDVIKQTKERLGITDDSPDFVEQKLTNNSSFILGQNDGDSMTPTPGTSPEYPDTSPAYYPNTPTPGTSPGYNPNTPSPKLENEDFEPQDEPKSPLDKYIQEQEAISNVSGPFTQNDIVIYTSDTIPDRMWEIIKVGPKFITIRTEDMRQLSMNDSVKIVPKNLIQFPNKQMGGFDGPIIPASFMQGGYAPIPSNINAMNGPNVANAIPHGPIQQGSGQGTGQGTGGSGITFAPTIKIMGGSDLSIGAPNTNAPVAATTNGGLVDTPQNVVSDALFGNINMNNMLKPLMNPSKIVSAATPPGVPILSKPEESQKKTTGGGILDFAKSFLIKKME